MYWILAILLLLSNATAYAASQLVYANSHWQVIYTEKKGYTARCYMTTQGSPFGDGYTYLVLSHNNILQFVGNDIGDLIESATRILLRAGEERVEIPVNSPVSGIMLFHTLMNGKVVEIVVTVDGKSRTVHTFPTHGFQHAHMRMTECLAEIRTKSRVQVITIEAGK